MLTVFTAAIQGCMRSSKIHPKRVCHSGLRMSNCAAASNPSSGDSEGRAQQPRQEVWTGKAGRKQGIIPRPPMLETKAGRLICRNKSPKEVPPASGHDSRELNLCISQSFRQPDTAGRLTQLSQQPADVFFYFFFHVHPGMREKFGATPAGQLLVAATWGSFSGETRRQRRGEEVCHRQPAST